MFFRYSVASSHPTTAGIPGVLVVWAYQQKQLFFWKRAFFFARKREKKSWVFFSFFCCCCAFGGCFYALGVFFVFRASARFFLGELIYKAHHTKTGNSRSAPNRQAELGLASSWGKEAPFGFGGN